MQRRSVWNQYRRCDTVRQAFDEMLTAITQMMAHLVTGISSDSSLHNFVIIETVAIPDGKEDLIFFQTEIFIAITDTLEKVRIWTPCQK